MRESVITNGTRDKKEEKGDVAKNVHWLLTFLPGSSFRKGLIQGTNKAIMLCLLDLLPLGYIYPQIVAVQGFT